MDRPLRLSPSVAFASVAVARHTIHQQLFGPPRAANRRSKSHQLLLSTSRKESLGVLSLVRPGNMIGSKTRCSHATGLRQPQGELTVRTDVAGNEVLDMLGDGGAFDVAAGLNFEGSIF